MAARPVVAFDVDCTLIDEADEPRIDVLSLLVNLERYCAIVVWSGCGKDYAEMQGRRLGLPASVTYSSKVNKGIQPDVALDDQEISLATVNICVGDAVMSDGSRVRAESPLEKNDVIERLAALWKANPRLRLGQLLCNAVPAGSLHGIEDYRLISLLEETYGE